ncbi:MAG: cytochrome c [Enhygromyxa sp.]
MASSPKPLVLVVLAALVLLAACAEDEDSNPELEVAPETAPETEQHDDHACTTAERMRVEAILDRTPDKAAGAQLYTQTCATVLCHGTDGVGGPAPSLAETIPAHSDAELGCVLLLGPGEMTSLESLSDQQLADVIAYVRATF